MATGSPQGWAKGREAERSEAVLLSEVSIIHNITQPTVATLTVTEGNSFPGPWHLVRRPEQMSSLPLV